ncbi:MAG TPA: hypothetical protein DC013_03575, partial [Ruminococcaceae bacterium]|nr:hypothetical protein [Oscillospiraceae bacterium]
MKKFGEIFSRYLDVSRLPDPVCGGTVTALQIDEKKRDIIVEAAFPSLVERRALFSAEKQICSALSVTSATICPKFQEGSFRPEYFPELVQELKRRDASLNGSLKDA